MPTRLKNICIIAHVDHGKTTLVDFLLRQAGTFAVHEALSDRVMDSGDLERERGITILAKNTSIHVGDTKINIVDTPGHADFGGEVERIMGMVDGALLLVDAAEGPLPQTRFVLEKALKTGLKVILVINKVDRPECQGNDRISEVINQTFDLFVELGANEEQVDFPILYACARRGWCTTDEKEIPALLSGERKGSLKPLFDSILSTIPDPALGALAGFQMLIANLSYSDYVGRLAVGRITCGSLQRGQKLIRHGKNAAGALTTEAMVATRIYTFEGLEQREVESIAAGDIGVVAGTDDFQIGDTLAGDETVPALPRISVEEPTLAMMFSVNTSPMAGLEGEAVQSRKLRERLLREVRHNVALRYEDTEVPDRFKIKGRGELQFAILIEQMRREGFEFMVAKPEVLYRDGEKGEKLEPFERAVMDLPEEHVGDVTQMFQQRKGVLTRYTPLSESNMPGVERRVRIEIEIPSRGLLGIRSRYLTATRGRGLLSTDFLGFRPFKGEIIQRVNGALVADRPGKTIEYGLRGLEDRGVFFVGIGVPVYEGMVVGEHAKDTDLNVNVCREKKLTNIRAAHAEVLVVLAGIRQMSLEQCLEWIDDDEWIEVTPQSVRMRKKILALNMRSVRRRET